jgi:hypothetical protein
MCIITFYQTRIRLSIIRKFLLFLNHRVNTSNKFFIHALSLPSQTMSLRCIPIVGRLQKNVRQFNLQLVLLTEPVFAFEGRHNSRSMPIFLSGSSSNFRCVDRSYGLRSIRASCSGDEYQNLLRVRNYKKSNQDHTYPPCILPMTLCWCLSSTHHPV